MPFDWNNYIALAKTLNAMANDSAKRSAVSRAYYGAFHRASDVLRSNGVQTFPRDQRKSHAKIWNVYKESAKKNCRRIGAQGGRLLNDRHDADYDSGRNFDAAEVTTFIADVEALVAAVAVPANVPEGFTGAVVATTRPSLLCRTLEAVKRFFGC